MSISDHPVLWGLLAAVIVIMFAIVRSRSVARIGGACLRLIMTAAILLCVLWVVFCDRTTYIRDYDDGHTVLIIGRVMAVRWAADGRRAAYEIVDPFGRATIVSASGAPKEGAYAIIRGYKGSFPSARFQGADVHNQPFVQSEFRLSMP